MNLLIALALLISVSLPSLGQQDLVSRLDHYIRPFAETNNFSGTVLISKKGKILFHKAYGFANREFQVPNDTATRFHIASISKTFTAAAILILEQRGLLSTDDLLTKYIPDYPSGDKITIHHLLAHTSGITNVNDLPEFENSLHLPQTLESLIAMFKNKPLEFQPGEKYHYSNSNYNLLAFIIEQVSKMKYGEFLSTNIFKPLSMTRTMHPANSSEIVDHGAEGYSPEGISGIQKSSYLDWSTKTGNGSLISTARDLEKWNEALWGTQILSEKSKTKMFTLYAGSGYGWYIKKQVDRNCIYMNGRSPGFSSHIARYPDEQVCVIVLTNNYMAIANVMGLDLAAMVFGKTIEPPAFTNAKVDETDAQKIVGKYQFGKDFYRPDYVMTVTARDGNIFTDWGELIPCKSLNFIQRSYWSKISFTKNPEGKITSMILDNYVGVRIE